MREEIKQKEKKPILKINMIASFDCGIYQNAIDIAIALAKAGRFINITATGTGYCVWVYKRA